RDSVSLCSPGCPGTHSLQDSQSYTKPHLQNKQTKKSRDHDTSVHKRFLCTYLWLIFHVK
ncbi:mCG140557, partial [Mus musculus]